MMPDASALPIAPRRSGIAIWVIGLSLLAFLCYLPFIDSTPLSGTEAHRALPADEMARHGDWLIPHLYGRIYFRKPPLHFWVLATIEKVTGQANSFTWRMGATIPGAMLVGLMCWFGARWFGKVGGIVSGVACISLIAIWAQNRSADIDAGNTLMTALASLSLIELQFGKTRRPGRWIIAASLAVGALLMYKGPAGLPTVGGGAAVHSDRRNPPPAGFVRISTQNLDSNFRRSADLWRLRIGRHLNPQIAGNPTRQQRIEGRRGKSLRGIMGQIVGSFQTSIPSLRIRDAGFTCAADRTGLVSEKEV